MRKIYILDLKNRQEEYAAALDFIKAIKDEKKRTIEERQQIMIKIAEKISIFAAEIKNDFSARYLEEPISISERGNVSVGSVQNKHKFTESDTYILERKSEVIRFHIRVHLSEQRCFEKTEESEIIHLQYLAMLLKRVSHYFLLDTEIIRVEQNIKMEEELNRQLKKHLTVFIVPLTSSEYPFSDYNGQIDYYTYICASRYLRLLSKRYTGVIYGVDEVMGSPVVTSLDFKKNKKCKTFFPLIIIDKNKYNDLFVSTIDQVLEELFSLRKNRRFRNSRDENPNVALMDYIAEADLYRIRDVIGEESYWSIFKFLKERGNITLMEFSLFAFMLSRKISRGDMHIWNENCMNIWHFAHEINQGLKQVVQNAIQHTEGRECFFSFCFHKKRTGEETNTFISRILQSYPNTFFNSSADEGALEIFVSDLNEKEDMIESFVSNLKYEINEQSISNQKEILSGHLKLIECQEKIAIRNFFSEYAKEDAKDAWRDFRQEDLVAHIGLSQFAQTAYKCRASVKVLSNKSSELIDEKRYFYHAYASEDRIENTYEETFFRGRHVIPGMQISILIPVHPRIDDSFMGIGQLKQENHVAENYVSFATFLDYEEKRIRVKLRENGTHVQYTELLDAKKKYRSVQKWRRYWEEKFEHNESLIKENSNTHEKYVFNYDFADVATSTYFNDNDRIEVFLKGLISALDFSKRKKDYFLIALTNLSVGFVEILRRICVQLSIKKFPKNLQLCLYEKNGQKVVLLGDDFSHAIYNSYVLSMEHGIAGFDKDDCEKASELKATLMAGMEIQETENIQKKLGACPFDVIMHCSSEDNMSFFEKQLRNMAEGSLDEEVIGYKLNNTHMRLGSKVHIEAFYEMSFLFYRTTIANRLAFNILRRMQKKSVFEEIKEKKIDLLEDNILFYGYASYSKAILTSISEILREYRKIHDYGKVTNLKNKVAFASFQHNLMLESEETQMYYDLPAQDFPGSVDIGNHLNLQEKVKVIQIVPISSTLTTFDKMWKKFFGSVVEKSKNMICLSGNYTVFWVVDKNGDIHNGNPSKIEERYWKKVYSGNEIETKLPILKNAGNEYVQYFIRSSVVWHDPLACKLCYPDYVIDEVPLVETDPTSTVPAQQIRYKGNQIMKMDTQLKEEYKKFKELMDCVSYDHICRRQNHYQFYVDTQRYFYNVKEMVKVWLKEGQKESQDTKEPVLNIIFSPEHNTNVGFVQYVNTYYFNGLAEIVSINVDKQFRSNFICEHAALKRIIEELNRDRRNLNFLPVRFYFVDDTIITGDTIEKANGLLHSLVPSNEYPVNLFSKIFVLIDRISDTTKKMYIDNPKQNFMSFLHMDVSNIRTHGDSCIGCKLEQDAKKMYKRSATKNMALYWSRKLNDYRKKAYDNRDDIAGINKEKSYRMLMFAHVLQNIIVKQGKCYEMGDVYDIMTDMSLWMLRESGYDEKCAYGYSEYLESMRNINGIKILLKTMCRPFFIYDFKIKRQAYTFFIYLAELMLGEKSNLILPKDLATNPHISYLTENNRMRKMEVLSWKIRQNLRFDGESELEFLRDFILEGLTDMSSTYVMRLQTIRKLYLYLENDEMAFTEQEKINFWSRYGICLHRLVNGNADESRELWLEYLYMTGMEYNMFRDKSSVDENNDYVPQFLYKSITGKDFTELKDKHFYQFCHNLFLQNTGINFDGLEEKITNHLEEKPLDGGYLESCWKQMRCLDTFINPLKIEEKGSIFQTVYEEKLFELLKNETKDMTEESVNQWYETLLNRIINVIVEKYDIKKNKINIAMLTETKDDKKNINHMQLLDIVKKNINYDKVGNSETCFYIKERVMNALESKNVFDLENNGYTLCWDSADGFCRPYIIAFFDSLEKQSSDSYERSLARVFLYISIAELNGDNKTQFVLRLILRDVMTYRNRILRFLKKDFGGEIYASYAHKVGEKNILSHEKAHSHNTTADDKISLEIFQKIKIFGEDSEYKILKRQKAAEWLLLRNYTNGQIAKMFNRGFHDDNDEGDISHLNIPMLYISKDSKINDNIFKKKLNKFSDLNLSTDGYGVQDERFELLREIMEIEYKDDLNNAVFIQGKTGQCYNVEYFKCIIIDILLSAIKFESDRPDYLLRIDHFLDIKRILKEKAPLWKLDAEEMLDFVERRKKSSCYVQIYREKSANPQVDYLVIRNRVDKLAHRLSNWRKENETIMHRLKDPLDYADGHMSLLAIKRYIENLDETNKLECIFKYSLPKTELGEKEELYFESCLPVLKGGN